MSAGGYKITDLGAMFFVSFAKVRNLALAAKQARLKIGYYHFCRPDKRNGGTITNDATAEADEAVNRMSVIPKADLPLVPDLEDSPPMGYTSRTK